MLRRQAGVQVPEQGLGSAPFVLFISGGKGRHVVETGAEALKLIDERNYDIVVSDIRMEGVDGLDVLRHVRARAPRTLVIMITGFATVEVARQALTMGAFDFIAKPFKLDDLRATILRAAEKLAREASDSSGR